MQYTKVKPREIMKILKIKIFSEYKMTFAYLKALTRTTELWSQDEVERISKMFNTFRHFVCDFRIKEK